MSLPAIPNIFKLNRGTGSPRRLQDNLTIFLFLLPGLILFLVFVIYPIFQSIYYSMFNWKGFGPAEDFVGLDNFKNILGDKVFMIALRNAFLLIVFSLLLQLPLSLILAVMVGRDLPGRAFFRTIFFMPYVISEVITAIMWLFLLNPNPNRGFVNAVIVAFGGEAQPWLGDTTLVLPSLFIALTWKYFGFHMLLYMQGCKISHMRSKKRGALMEPARSKTSFTSLCLCWEAPFAHLYTCPSSVPSSNSFWSGS